jgi:kynurenine formamidase
MFDLTQPLTPHIPRYPGDPEVRVEPLPGFAPWHVSALVLGTHSGTHIDAPRHRIPGAPGIGSYGPQRLVGTGFVIDVGARKDNEPIPASVLDDLRGRTVPGWFAVLRTGWDRYWQDERYFWHPHLSPQLADALTALGAGIVAIDALSVDSTVDSLSTVHLTLLGADVLIAENLCHLDALQPGRLYAFAFLHLSLGAADGSPARVVAWDPGRGPRQGRQRAGAWKSAQTL